MLFIKNISATISILTLVLYDFLCLFRIIKKEKIVEKLWNELLPGKQYNEMVVFSLIRPMLLTTAFFFFIVSSDVLQNFLAYKILVSMTPVFALGTLIRNIQK